MNILAIDTSCDDSSAAIFDTNSWQLLSDVVISHVESMKSYGGVVPEIASREHVVGLPRAIHRALAAAGLSYSNIDWIAVTDRPGLVGSLAVGMAFCKSLSLSLGKPLTAVDHLSCHVYSPFLGESVPPFPWLAMVVSGGHTEMFHVLSATRLEWLGGTLDDAAGEAFDKIGKLLGMAYPAGPFIDQWVRNSATPADRQAFQFPVAQVDGFAFSFSGLKTAVNLEVQKLATVDEKSKLALCASAQEAVLDQLVGIMQKARRAAPDAHPVVTGGVACNSRLREKMAWAYFPQPRHCSDNAAMVAIRAALLHREGSLRPSPLSVSISPRSEFFESELSR